MKKIIFILVIFAYVANGLAQVEVDSIGDAYVTGNILLESTSNFLGTISNSDPLTFKVSSSLVGFTGCSGKTNVSFGYGALSNPLAGTGNVAIGSQALRINSNTNNNTAVGYAALGNNTSGMDNTASGNCALYNNSSGMRNTANGLFALYSNKASYNTAVGYFALQSNTTGNANTALGQHALQSNVAGSSNTAVGYGADVIGSSLTNITVIGNGAKVSGSNQVVIGNSSITHIGGYVAWTSISDGRTKKNIRPEVPGLTFINRLQPVMYNFDLDAIDELLKSEDPEINHFRDSVLMARSPEEKEMDAKAKENKEKQVYSGFIAQDVEAAAQSVGYDFSGVDAPENGGKGPYGLRYAEFVVPLVKAVQELSEQNGRLLEQVNEFIETAKVQQGIIDELKQKVEKLEENTPVVNLRSDTGENTVMDLPDAVVVQCKLYQNAPNPFNQNTEIRFYVPENVKVAKLCIYNLQGAQVKQIVIMQRGEGSQWISGSELTAGMYLYALIADGKEVAVKRMVLTE